MTSPTGRQAGKDSDVGSLSRAGDLFQLLRDGRARTRAELALSTGLARSTVASRIDALMLSGLVGPAGEALSSGGRPPSRFAFNPSARLVLAVDVGATHVIVALTDLGGNILAEHRLAQQVADGPEAVLDQVVAQGKELLASTGRTVAELAGIGIGLPGPVEHATGMPVKPPIMPGWDGFDVVSYVQRSFPVAVLVDNDVNIMALGERTAHWPEHDNFLFIKVAEGNLQAIQALRQAGRDVGDVLATVVNLLNPSVIVVGGSLGQAGEHLMAGVREVVYRRSLPLATTHLRIGLSMAGGQAAVLGASQMVTQHVLSPTVIEATLQA